MTKINKYKAKVVRLIDGDTVELDIDLGFYITHRIIGRLVGVNTPERGEPMFSEATDVAFSLLHQVENEEGEIIIETHRTGKYGRWLVTIKGVNDVLSKRWPYDN